MIAMTNIFDIAGPNLPWSAIVLTGRVGQIVVSIMAKAGYASDLVTGTLRCALIATGLLWLHLPIMAPI